ncbi:MAG: hypothetical protein ACLFST_14825 [Spirochaetia bacterium]
MQKYQRFYNAKSYINSKTVNTAAPFKLPEKQKEMINDMMKHCGFRNFRKFLALKNSWDNLASPVPLRYLEYIDVKPEALKYALSLDKDQYREETRKKRYPDFATVMLRLGGYQRVSIPAGYDEDEAIEFLFQRMEEQKRNLKLVIHYEGLLRIFMELPDRIDTEYYPPDVEFRQTEIVPCPGKLLKIRRMR